MSSSTLAAALDQAIEQARALTPADAAAHVGKWIYYRHGGHRGNMILSAFVQEARGFLLGLSSDGRPRQMPYWVNLPDVEILHIETPAERAAVSAVSAEPSAKSA